MRNITSSVSLFILIVFVFCFYRSNAQITLTHNVGNVPIETEMFSCEGDEIWARIFDLADFGISENEQFIIRSGQIGLSKSHTGASLDFKIYSIDDNIFPFYPYSQSPITLLGVKGIGPAPEIDGSPEIIEVDFDNPIVVPASVKRILVTVHKFESSYDPESAEVFIAGTEEDNGDSWYLGCNIAYNYTPTNELSTPVENANFFINVTGEPLNIYTSGSRTRLSHNVCDNVLDANMYSCRDSYVDWARTFTLSDFGISNNEQLTITSGQVALFNVSWLPEIKFNIYAIDENFPDSFDEDNLLGSSQYVRLTTLIDDHSQVWQVDFENPVTIPLNVDRILVEVHKGIIGNSEAVAFIGRTAFDNDESWQRGCEPDNKYRTTTELGNPDANFYINVLGNVVHKTNEFSMDITNICSEFLKEFKIVDENRISTIAWDFGDPASGANNGSSELSPFHDFSSDGTYTITATITGVNGNIEVISETISVQEPPNAYGINDIYVCEEQPNTGFSSSIDLSQIENQVLGDQSDKTVTFIDGSGNIYNEIPYPFTNTVSNRETIKVIVSHLNNNCCSSETTFDIIIQPKPSIESISNLNSCEIEVNSGFGIFNLEEINQELLASHPNTDITFYYQNGEPMPPPLNSVSNEIPNEETIKIIVTDLGTECSNETTFKLIVDSLPEVNDEIELLACDDNGDGISEYFDTSNVEEQILNGQSGISLSYFNQDGIELSNPLPNPYTNINPFNDLITVRLTDEETLCFTKTVIELKTVTEPIIYQPANLFACDTGSGFGEFDTTDLVEQIIGNQTGLEVLFYDTDNNPLPSPLPATFINSEPYIQTIIARVEDSNNPLCYAETNFDLVVNALPVIDLDKDYLICDLDPSLLLSIPSGYSSYLWTDSTGEIVSTSYSAEIINEDNYSLTVTKIENGVECYNSFNFSLRRSVLPQIENVYFGELGNNFIEIIASGDGEFEYSIDGVFYQDSNYFSNISGGIYNVSVRDKYGCGESIKEVTVIDFPKFFTPNSDGINDTWEIKGIRNFPDFKVLIFDRYGRILQRLDASNLNWNGRYNGDFLKSDDYWFKADLGNGKTFSGHFALRR